MNELQLFENPEFGQIRVVEKDGEPWFVAVDVCRALEIKNNRDAMTRLDDDERGVVLTDTPSGKQEMNIINEAGLYSLVLGSRKPEAKAFKRWVTHEVIPTIRKHGMYATSITVEKMISDPDYAISLLQALKDERAKRKCLEEENEIQRQMIADYEPKVSYYDLILQSKESLTVTQIAADYGISAIELNRILHKCGIQHKVGKQWVLYRKYMGKGYTKSVTHQFYRTDGSCDSQMQTKWTQKGRVEIHKILERLGIQAVMDREDV